MQIYVFNRRNEVWDITGAVAIVAENQEVAEAFYRQEFDFEFEISELEITSGLMLVADGYDSTEMNVRHLTHAQPDRKSGGGLALAVSQPCPSVTRLQ
jgi:hypothetical protein